MPFKTYLNWLFDGKIDSPIPAPRTNKEGKVMVPDILKYNSPITPTYVISVFMRNGPLNHYLNEYFNNMGLRYLDKEELFKFIKKCVIKFRVRRRDILFKKFRRDGKLFLALREKIPELKNYEISSLCEIVNKSEERERIYYSLGLEKPKKKRIRKTKPKKIEKISLKEFLEENFSFIKK